KKGETFVLHIEFQVKDESKMVFRMAEYFIMLLRRYGLPIRQYVLYIGTGIPAMKDYIRQRPMNFKYQLISLSSVDYHLLLRSHKPEEKMLAILANLGSEDPGKAVKNIVKQTVASSKGHFDKLRHIVQLRILAQLRNLANENLEIMDSIAGIFSEKKDILYRRGEKKGVEKGVAKEKKSLVKNLLLQTNFTLEKIASLTNVTVDFVKKVKKSVK
ncbi:MAG TPA: hypothetical protein VHW43_12780, partial [Puia sp.]|nr:hypothetical protein [Puia sp.]